MIPNVQWGDDTNGCIQGKLDRAYFKKGLQKMVEVLEPSVIMNYSNTPDDIFKPYKDAGLEIVHLPNWHKVVRGQVIG